MYTLTAYNTADTLFHRQLPTESKLFASVDKAWKEIMRKTEDKPNALRAATASGVLEMLQVANTNLEKIQKCLEVGGATVVTKCISSVHVTCSIESLWMTVVDMQLSFEVQTCFAVLLLL